MAISPRMHWLGALLVGLLLPFQAMAQDSATAVLKEKGLDLAQAVATDCIGWTGLDEDCVTGKVTDFLKEAGVEVGTAIVKEQLGIVVVPKLPGALQSTGQDLLDKIVDEIVEELTNGSSDSVSLDELKQAQADARHNLRIDILGSVGEHIVGGAGWFVMPVLHDGFVPGLNDSLDLELGGYVARYFGYNFGYTDYVFIEPALGVKWNFHILNELTAYVGARTGFVFALGDGISEPDGGGIVGLYWHLGQGVDLRFEVGYRHVRRAGGQLGVSFPF